MKSQFHDREFQGMMYPPNRIPEGSSYIKNILYLCGEIVEISYLMKGEVPTLSHYIFWYIILNIGTMKTITLTKGQVALVDDEDYDFLMQWKWCTSKQGNVYYVVANNGSINKKRQVISMHRLIMNTPKGMEVDHTDHNGLNNQKENLRNCNRSQNSMNKTARGVSKYLGVAHSYQGNYDYIVAGIRINGIKKHLGIFKTEELAAKAYDDAAKKYHREFANLNFK